MLATVLLLLIGGTWHCEVLFPLTAIQLRKTNSQEPMKNITKTILAVLAAGLVSTALSTHEVQAAHINGTIDFAGSVMFDSSHLDNVTQVMLWRDVFGNLGFSNVAANTGDFSFIPLGTQATMAYSMDIYPLNEYSGSLESVGVSSRSIS